MRARSSLIRGSRKTATVAAWRLVEPNTSRRIPDLITVAQNAQTNNALFAEAKKFYPTRLFLI